MSLQPVVPFLISSRAPGSWEAQPSSLPPASSVEPPGLAPWPGQPLGWSCPICEAGRCRQSPSGRDSWRLRCLHRSGEGLAVHLMCAALPRVRAATCTDGSRAQASPLPCMNAERGALCIRDALECISVMLVTQPPLAARRRSEEGALLPGGWQLPGGWRLLWGSLSLVSQPPPLRSPP